MSLHKDDNFVNNPFVALFPNVEHAKQYVEATQKGLQQSQKLLPTQTVDKLVVTDSKNEKEPMLQKLLTSNKAVIKEITQSKEIIINDYLQRVFLITVNCDENNLGLPKYGGVPQRCIILKELQKELTEASLPLLLTMENLNQALLERLQLSEPVLHLCIQSAHFSKAVDAVMEAKEDLLVKYLAATFGRLCKEEVILQRKITKDKTFTEEFVKLSESCKKLIISFTGSILLQPEVFPTNNAHLQLFNVLLECEMDHNASEFIKKLTEQYSNPDDLHTMFVPTLDMLWERAKNLKIMQPDVFPLLSALLVYSKNATLAEILLKSKYWLPQSLKDPSQNVIGLAFEVQTILGCFLRLSPLPPDLFISVPELFLEPSKQSEQEMSSITDNVRHQLEIIVSKIHEFLYNMVQKPEIQHEILYWFGICLHLNMKRFQMMNDGYTVCHSGFFLNLTHVLLKFCEPFLNPGSKLLLKVDFRYGAATSSVESIQNPDTPLHAVGLEKLTPMVPKPDNIPPIDARHAKFKFVSEIFFLTHLCYKLGFIKAYESYQELMKRLQKMNNMYQDARLQGTGDELIDQMKTDFENGIRRQLAAKAHLVNPTLADLALRFSSASSYWLVQQTLAGDEYMDLKHRDLKAKKIIHQVPPALTVIPDFVAESIGDTIRLMGYFDEDCLERCDSFECIMEFFAVFLGSSSRIKNPHLRAKLAECLSAFLPKERNNKSNVFSFSFRKKAFDQSSVVPKILPEALLQLFVDIEFTGHTMEFEQKFTYRHYMYEVLECIWKLPAYAATLRKLYEEGKYVYKKNLTFSAFPRFINLLVNDSTFLLDEALQHLVMIKTYEKEKESGEWKNLSHDDRSQKEQNLLQFEHFARAYNTMANETVHVLCYITRDITRPFASPCMADGMAAFLNYFFLHLVGPKRKDLKVSDFKKYNFDPGNLVKNITMIYLYLGKEDDFCRAIVKDTGSYSDELFQRAVELVGRLDDCQHLLPGLNKLTKRLTAFHKKFCQDEAETPEPPDEFLDPISCMLMYEPVKLPSSGQILCKSTIAKHLLSDEKDPFNRSPLRLDQVLPCTELQGRIQEWMIENNVPLPEYTSEDCGG